MDLIESYKEELQLMRKPWTRVWVGALVLFLLVLPFYAPEHIVYITTIIFIYTIGVQGQNLLIGYTGQISFGQAGFLAIGAFTFGHMSRLGLPWPLGLLLAGLAAGVFGLVVGFPSLRLKGPYLAIATLGFGIAVYQIFVNSELLSGGRMGLIISKLSPPFGLSAAVFNYYFNFLIALLFTLLTYNIISSFMGRAFIAIRDNDIAAEVIGVNLTSVRFTPASREAFTVFF
jgi:branched-chain amino acid transport system permease protein